MTMASSTTMPRAMMKAKREIMLMVTSQAGRITSYNVCYTKLLRFDPLALDLLNRHLFPNVRMLVDRKGSKRNNFV